MRLRRALDQLVVQRERLGHGVGLRLPERRRALDVGHQERHDPARQVRRCGRLAGRLRWPALHGLGLREPEPGVLRKHRRLELPEPLAGLDAQLLDQRPARVLVGLEGVRLAVGSVEREHQLRA